MTSRCDRWSDYFRLVGRRIETLTATGGVIARLLQCNHPHRTEDHELLKAAGVVRSLFE
jgi:hypothetical protein